MRQSVAFRTILFTFMMLSLSAVSSAQVGISVSFGPPALPVYEQPICPGDGYIWTPGYWAWEGSDYYWVPGTWIEAPEVGFLWTPGYWGWGGSAFYFHEGYWGPHVGYYGGINYGFGYGGHGYEGGRWENSHFYYNTSVNRINNVTIHNTYNTRVEYNSANRVSYNGGRGGVNERPSAQEATYDKERHSGPVAAQNQQMQQARSSTELRASANQGKPPVAATSRSGDFTGSATPAKEAGAPYKAPERAAAGNESRPSASTHASEVQPHKYSAPSTGKPATDQKYQQQQDKLAVKQNQEHQKLQQQQAKEHQQATQKSTNDVQKQQMEQRHTQQTQQLEQKHTSQQQNVQSHQQPHQSSPPPQSHPPAEKH